MTPSKSHLALRTLTDGLQRSYTTPKRRGCRFFVCRLNRLNWGHRGGGGESGTFVHLATDPKENDAGETNSSFIRAAPSSAFVNLCELFPRLTERTEGTSPRGHHDRGLFAAPMRGNAPATWCLFNVFTLMTIMSFLSRFVHPPSIWLELAFRRATGTMSTARKICRGRGSLSEPHLSKQEAKKNRDSYL